MEFRIRFRSFAQLFVPAHVELPVTLLSPPPANAASSSSASTSAAPIVNVKKDAKKKYHLTTATDPLYAELRDLNFSSVGRKLNTVARRLDEDYKVKVSAYSLNFDRVHASLRQIYKLKR